MIIKKLVTIKGKIFLLEEKISDFKDIKDEEILVQTKYSTCKHGTEDWIIKNKAHWLKFKRDKEGNYFTKKKINNFNKTSTLGNMFIGKIITKGKKVINYKLNDLVLCYGGAQDAHVINQSSIVLKIPEKSNILNYLLFDPMEFSIGAIRDASLKFGDDIGIVGLGAIGLTTVKLCKISGANRVFAIDKINTRLSLAKKMGADYIVNTNIFDPAVYCRKNSDKKGLDIVFDFSGSSEGLNQAIRCCAYGGKVVVGSMHKPANKDLKLGMEFHWNNIKLISSRASNEPNLDFPRWSRNKIHDLIRTILISKDIDFSKIIQKTYSFKNAAEIYKRNIKTKKDIKLTFKH